jgi:magnesium chelatase subunit D
MRVDYPFAALVGQDALREALLCVAVDPAIGGVLVTGTRGSAKSTAARGLVGVLPPIDVRADDAFNSAPERGAAGARTVPTPFVELPVGATEDRVIGTLDVRALLTDGQRRFEPGLLARANRGILYIDEVNLLPDHLVDVVLDAAATGVNVVEREGASFVHDARIVLVGTMNPEEGELRPQLLDRFGLCVAIESDDDPQRRVEILRRRLAFELDPTAFAAAYADRTEALRARVARARALLGEVVVDDDTLAAAAESALAARAEGLRGDLAIVRTARALAALDGRHAVGQHDVERAAMYALAHRRREPPRGAPPRPPGPPPPPPPSSPPPPQGEDRGDAPPPRGGTEAERTLDVGAPANLRWDEPAFAPRPARESSRGRTLVAGPRGRAVVVAHVTARIAVLPTLVAAARDESRSAQAGLAPHHLRFIERRGRPRGLVVFLVDASGSMAGAARMRAAKGAIGALLEDAYHRRDAVALLAFRGTGAELLVPPTRSAALAFRRMRALPVGGRTPLAAGLRRAHELSQHESRRDPGLRVSLVVVTDARANHPQTDAIGEALREARALRAEPLRALCLDTETGRVRLRNVERLATALGAEYRHLDACDERALGAAIKEWMATAS